MERFSEVNKVKKRLNVLLCVLMVVLGIAGCGSRKQTVEYDKEILEQYAEGMISSFAVMNDEAFEQFEKGSELQVNLSMMQIGLPIEKEALVSMMNAWKAAIDECGAYEGHGEFEAEADKSGVILSTEAEYEDRNATIAIQFDENLTMESMDISAEYGMGEILKKAGINTLLGMGTVFAVLIFLAFIISLMKYIPALFGQTKQKENVKETTAKQPEAAVTESVEEVDDYELVAVITAAIAAQEGTSTDGFVVRSIKRRPSNKWV